MIAPLARRPDLCVALALALLALALMSPYLFRPDVIVWPRSGLGTDLLNYRWAHVHHFRQSLRRDGAVPLWRGPTLGGEPMIGNPAVMLVYPLQLLVALLPIPVFPSFALLTAVHLWIAGMGTYVLTHAAVGVRRPAALVAALVVMLTPRLSSNAVGDAGTDYAMCWVPLCLAWAKLAIERRWVHWAVLAGFGLACQFLLHVHIFFYTAWVVGLLLLYRIAGDLLALRRGSVRVPVDDGAEDASPGAGAVRRTLVRTALVALAAVICAGLVAFELLPFISYLPHLSRAALTLADASRYQLPLSVLYAVLMPLPLKFPEWELYVGLLPLLLLPFAFRHSRRDETWFWVGLAVLGIVFSLGSALPLYPLLVQYVPGFSWLRVPARMWVMVAVSSGVLTGLAVDALADEPVGARLGRGWRLWLFIGAWVLAVGTIGGRWLTRWEDQADWMLGFLGTAGLVLGIVGIWLWSEGRIRYGVLIAMLVGALLLDLLPVDAAYMMAMPVEQAFEMPAIGRTLLEPETRALAPFRVHAVHGEIAYHIPVWEGLELVEGLSSFQFARYVAFARRAGGCDLPGFAASVPPCTSNELSSTAYLQASPDASLLGLLNVRYVIAPRVLEGKEWVLRDAAEGSYLYENLDLQPRAFGVGRIESLPGEQALWQRLSEVDVGAVALVESADGAPAVLQEPFHEPARLVERRPNRISVEIDMPGDGMLVLGEVWTPGWRATVDRVPARVWRVNGALRGVYLSPGAHRIELRFLPTTLLWGLAISAVTAAACVVLLVRAWKRHRHSS